MRRIASPRFNMQPPARTTLFVVFRDGWHDAEVADEAGLEWQWSKKRGDTVVPESEAGRPCFILELDQPVQALCRAAAGRDPDRVDAVVDSFTLAPAGRQRELSPDSAERGSSWATRRRPVG